MKLEIGRGHDVQPPAFEPDPAPRLQLDRTARDPREAPLDDLDGVRRAEELFDIRFAKVERHWAG